MVGREVAVGRTKGALQLDGIAFGKRHQSLQPERRRLGACAPETSPLEPRISVDPFNTSRPRIRALVLELTLKSSVAPKR